MTPVDDASWPKCGTHDEAQHWCERIRQLLMDDADAIGITGMSRICVPVAPAVGYFAEVGIGNPVVGDMVYELFLVTSGNPFAQQEELVSLGLWTKGEGRKSIATTVNDWIEAQASVDKCIHPKHGFEEEMKFQAIVKRNNNHELKANRWCLAYYGKCVPCMNRQDPPVAPTDSWDASSFGLDPKNFRGTTGDAGAPTNARQNRAREALKNRFGN